MHSRRTILLSMLCLALMLTPTRGHGELFVDALDLPATPSPLARNGTLLDVTRAGHRIVAVGVRGHILYSDDLGQTWHQASAPVSSDLTAVYFPTPTQGWAVGHDGVVLHSTDTGVTWTRQLDGRHTGQLMLDYYSAQTTAQPDNENHALLVEESRRMVTEGADKPFLDIWFENDMNGYIVGAFNLIFRTQDGGQSWEPQQHLVDNPSSLHINAIAQAGTDLYLAGEQGLLLKRSATSGRFEALTSPYEGTYFGLLGRPDQIVAYGLRGHAYRSSDGGLSWHSIETGTTASLTAAASDAHGRLFLFTQAGQPLLSQDNGIHFKPQATDSTFPIASAVAASGESLILAGTRGLRLQPTPLRE